MMPSGARIHARFIDAVHRRLMVVRAAEASGVCLLAACMLIAPLLTILWWRGNSTSSAPLLEIITATWIVASIAVTIHRWPNVMAAAVEADRQFELADLLVTALSLDHGQPGRPTDLLAGEVLAMADARCQALSPSRLVLHRLGSRAWGGIGLSLALVITLALIPIHPGRSDASAGTADEILANASATPLTSGVVPARRPAGADPASEGSATMSTVEDQAQAIGSATTAADHSRVTETAGTVGGGGARSTSNRGDHKPDSPALAAGSSDSGNGVAAGGSKLGGNNGADDHSRSGGLSAAAQPGSRAIARWQGTQQHQAPSNDLASSAPDAVPTQYRDLVREYFQRDQ